MKEAREKIAHFYKMKKRMPSYAEIAELLGYKTKSAAVYAVRELIQQGVVVKDGTGRLLPGKLAGDLKVLGLVEAGFPSPAEEELLDVMSLDDYLVPHKESTYILKVKGDSMIDAGIHEGDMVIVERRQTYKPGQIVIASVDGEYTIKYLRRERDLYYLEPANPAFKPIYPKERLMIEAVVIGVVRKY